MTRFNLDRDAMFDLEKTAVLEALFAAGGPRDEAWFAGFYEAAWFASTVLVSDEAFSGPDGMPYLRLELPREGEAFESQSLGNLAELCLGRGCGAALFAAPGDPPEAAQFVFPFGVLDSMLRYDDPAAPAADYLPAYGARALHHYLTQRWELDEPRVQLLIDMQQRPTRNLIIGRKRSSFGDEGFLQDLMRYTSWYLPPGRGFALMPEDWSLEQMTPLRALFQER